MKKIKMFIMALVAIFACAGIAACSSDDNNNDRQELTDLIGTTWQGTNTANRYYYIITIKDTKTYNFKIVAPNGSTYEDKDWTYTYNAESRTINAQYRGNTYVGTIKGNTMTMIIDGVTVTLARK